MTEPNNPGPTVDTAGYDPAAVERKWQERWEKRGTNHTDVDDGIRPFYALMMFPYPSAEGLHVGNLFAFTGNDIYGRFQRLQGHTVFEPIGFDAFGIHSENFALKVGTHPSELIPRNIDNFRRQLKRSGLMIDWRHELSTTDPAYYKWTQWLFLQLYQRGLAYKKGAAVNWCPNDKTVLANEQVIAGECERCGAQGRAAVPRAVVFPHHRLRLAPARQPRLARLVGRRPSWHSATGSAARTAPRSASACRIWRTSAARPRSPAG